MKTALRVIPMVGLATVALVVLLTLRTLPTARVFAIWIVLLAGIALIALVRAGQDQEPQTRSRFEQALARGPRRAAERPRIFLAMEREIELSVAHAGHAHRRLVPLLRAAAAARLQTEHAVELEPGGEAAHRLLGDEAWEFLRPDRPPPSDPFGPGPCRETITAVIERLEAL